MVLIVEDDCTFYPGETYSKIIETVNKVPVWDVILLTASIYNFRSTPSVSKIEGVDKLLEGQAAAAYIVRDNYYDKLLENLRNSLAGLLDGKPEHIYAPDQQWKTLQSIDNWYIFSPIVAYQRPSYSDNSKVQGIYEFPRKLK